jgi:hypothetical protein
MLWSFDTWNFNFNRPVVGGSEGGWVGLVEVSEALLQICPDLSSGWTQVHHDLTTTQLLR